MILVTAHGALQNLCKSINKLISQRKWRVVSSNNRKFWLKNDKLSFIPVIQFEMVWSKPAMKVFDATFHIIIECKMQNAQIASQI